jgi:hypothetical protein
LARNDEIVAGERIGTFVLEKSVEELLPPGHSAKGLAELAMRHQVRIQLERNRLTEVSTSSPRFMTCEGFKVGGEFSAVVAAWGEPEDTHALDDRTLFDCKASYLTRGIDFVVKGDGILHIGVFPPMPPRGGEPIDV